MSHNSAHVCCVSDVSGAQGMERNIADQLNKAFEAYRQVSIEKENAKKQLQQMVKEWEGNVTCAVHAKLNVCLLVLFILTVKNQKCTFVGACHTPE